VKPTVSTLTRTRLTLDSRARLASLYSDFRHQRSTNPDGYQANANAWLRALSSASKAGLIPTHAGMNNDHFVLKTGEELSKALQTQEYGRPLALGAVVQDAVNKKELIPLVEFLNAKKSIYAKNWIPTPWQAVSWGLRQLGIMGGEPVEDRLLAGNFVVMANVEVRRIPMVSHATTLT
jgi:charged multivesicular body protein 7